MLEQVDLKRAYRTIPTGLYLISTAWQGKRNVQFAFRALGLSDDPPLLLLGIQQHNYSLELIRASKELVLNVCSRNQLHAISKSRGLSGRNVDDKFRALGLEVRPARVVKAPLVAGCHANVECRVVNEFETGDLSLVIAEPLVCHVDDELKPVARLSGSTFDLGGRAE